MFPSELVLEAQRKDMQRAAENHRLVQFVQEGQEQPTLFQRLRSHLSVHASTVEVQGSVTSTKPTEAIA